MTQSGTLPRALTAGLIVLHALQVPALAGDASATLNGNIVSAADRTPMSRARLHVANPRSGHFFSSRSTSGDGSFTFDALPAASYELAVEVNNGLYLVQTPVRLSPGMAHHITVMIKQHRSDEDDDDPVPPHVPIRTATIWDNPLTAAGLALGMAFVVGLAVEAVDDGPAATVSGSNP